MIPPHMPDLLGCFARPTVAATCPRGGRIARVPLFMCDLVVLHGCRLDDAFPQAVDESR